MRKAIALIAIALLTTVTAGLLPGAAAKKKKSSSARKKSAVTASKKAGASKASAAKKGAAKTAGKTAGKASGRKSSKRSRSKKGTATAKQTWRSRQLAPASDRYTEIQQALIAKGYLQGSPSGTWDRSSVDALRRFQQEQNIEPSGKINSLSLIALGLGPKYDSTAAAATPPPPRPPTQPSQPQQD